MLEKRRAPAVVRFGPFTLDLRSSELRNGPTRLKVPDQSIEILKALLERPGDLVSRDELRHRLWPPDTFVDFEAGLNAAVRRLRDALNDAADSPRFIETLPRRGYRFIAPVEYEEVDLTAVSGSGAAVSAEASAAPGLVSSSLSTPARSAGRTRFARWSVGIGILSVLAVGMTLWAGRPGGRMMATMPARAAPLRPLPVTSLVGLELHPALSPGGNQFAFAWEGESGDNFDIYVRSLDGGLPLRLTTDAAPDHSPVWSPDGQRIAFVRIAGGRRVIVAVPALGGPEQRLTEAEGAETLAQVIGGWSYGLSWTPDGTGLLFGAHEATANSAISLVSLENGQREQLTWPPNDFSDVHPVISPDRRHLAFVRMNGPSGNVFVQRIDGLRPVGDPVQLTFHNNTLALDWAADSRSIIHDSGYGRGGLWRIALGGGTPEPLLPNVRAGRPSVSPDGARVLFQNTTVDSNIWKLPGSLPPNRGLSQDTPVRVIASTFVDTSPQFSPDGTRIAFASFRSGTRDIWVSRSDGSQQVALTTSEGSPKGSPRWSPDGQSIAFDTMRKGTWSWNIGVISAEGGPVRFVTESTSNSVRPSWSGDGRWIYFGSDRTGDWQVWKVRSAGGTPVQVTRHGGREAIEAPDGTHLYYAKMPGLPGIWQVPVNGGKETQVVDRGHQAAWAVTDHGIVLVDKYATPRVPIELFSFASRQLIPIATLPPGLRLDTGNPSFSVSRDGRWMLYVQYDEWSSDIEMLQGLR